MTSYNRAAQFAPFSALVGYEELVKDAADILSLDKKVVLSEDQKDILDQKLLRLSTQINDKPEIQVLYFDKSSNDLGGGYASYSGILRRIEEQPCRLIMMDKKEIPICDILDIVENV